MCFMFVVIRNLGIGHLQRWKLDKFIISLSFIYELSCTHIYKVEYSE